MISVLLPTRDRSQLCMESVASLLSLAAHPDQIEIVMRRDHDDKIKYPELPRTRTIWGPPKGYAGLADYYNDCAAAAIGDWLMIWNDDCVMQTTSWDRLLHDRDPDAPANWLVMLHIHFPTLSRRWLEITGRMAASPHIDTFICHAAEILVGLGLIPPLEGKGWDIDHKCDVINDAGSERRRKEILGPGGTSAAFFKPDTRRQIEIDADKLAVAIRGLTER